MTKDRVSTNTIAIEFAGRIGDTSAYGSLEVNGSKVILNSSPANPGGNNIENMLTCAKESKKKQLLLL